MPHVDAARPQTANQRFRIFITIRVESQSSRCFGVARRVVDEQALGGWAAGGAGSRAKNLRVWLGRPNLIGQDFDGKMAEHSKTIGYPSHVRAASIRNQYHGQ